MVWPLASHDFRQLALKMLWPPKHREKYEATPRKIGGNLFAWLFFTAEKSFIELARVYNKSTTIICDKHS